MGATGYTEIQVIDAFANFFKHNEEWEWDWSKLKDRSRKTAEIITAVGASQGSTGNFRKGAAAIGNVDLTRVTILVGIIASWRGVPGVQAPWDLASQLEAEATKLGLLLEHRSVGNALNDDHLRASKIWSPCSRRAGGREMTPRRTRS